MMALPKTSEMMLIQFFNMKNRALLLLAIYIPIILRFFYILSQKTSNNLVSLIADDGLYYWIIAKNFSINSLSSFDNGSTITTGYHPLWMIILSIFTRFELGPLDQLKLFCIISLLFFTIGITVITCSALKFNNQLNGLPGLCLLICSSSYSFLTNSISGLEWPLVISINAIIFTIILNNECLDKLLIAFLLGLLGSLARTDFIIVPFTLLLTSFLLFKVCPINQWGFKYVKFFSLVSAGSIIGIAVSMLFFYYVSGSFIQNSAAIKSLWHSYDDAFRFDSVAYQFARAILYLPDFSATINNFIHQRQYLILALLTVIIVPLVFFILLRLIKHLKPENNSFNIASISSVFIIIIYFILYGIKVTEIQPWYSANVTLPILVCLVTFSFFICGRFSGKFKNIIFLVGYGIITINIYVYVQNPAPYPAQVLMKSIGEDLANKKHSNDKIGFSGAGAVSLFQGGYVINLDGLVNNEIIEYIPSRLPCYLIQKKITLFDGFGYSNIFLSSQEMDDIGDLYKTYQIKGSSVKIYKPNLDKIHKNYDCK